MKMNNMVKLLPSSFSYSKYDALTIPYSLALASKKKYLEWLRTQNIIGYLNGMELEIRPRSDSYGILIEDKDGYETWAHIPNNIFKAFLKK